MAWRGDHFSSKFRVTSPAKKKWIVISALIAGFIILILLSDNGTKDSEKTHPAIADDLQYNPDAARKAATFQNLDIQTRGCMNEGVEDMLQLGSRDRTQITSFAVKTCGGPLYNYMTHDLGRPAQEAAAYLNAMANDELDHVPGITSKPAQ